VSGDGFGQNKLADNNGGYEELDPLPIGYDCDDDYNEEMMEVQPDIILEGPDPNEPEQFDSIVEEEGVDPIQS